MQGTYYLYVTKTARTTTTKCDVYTLFYLKSLFGSIDNIVLERSRQGGEQRAVTSYADNERLVLFWILLRIKQRFTCDDVELHMHTLLIEIRTN